jgi:hypothetical protein
MGYTHYVKSAGVDAELWAKFLGDVRKVVLAANVPIQEESDNPNSPVLDDKEIRFNGVEDAGHETFCLTRHGGDMFCKTAQKPYDLVVCSILIAAKARFPNGIRVRSDGDETDWAGAFELVERTLGYTGAFDEEGCLTVEGGDKWDGL